METFKVNAEIVLAFEVAIGEWLELELSKPILRRDNAQIRRFRRVLRNQGMLNALANRYETDINASLSGNEDNRFFEIIQWIIENQDQILKFISALILLFGG
jgi:hypothetical protein